jgi:hypothetical protein
MASLSAGAAINGEQK